MVKDQILFKEEEVGFKIKAEIKVRVEAEIEVQSEA